jgi:hypothetical protein
MQGWEELSDHKQFLHAEWMRVTLHDLFPNFDIACLLDDDNPFTVGLERLGNRSSFKARGANSPYLSPVLDFIDDSRRQGHSFDRIKTALEGFFDIFEEPFKPKIKSVDAVRSAFNEARMYIKNGDFPKNIKRLAVEAGQINEDMQVEPA